jgi:hypothetical protein
MIEVHHFKVRDISKGDWEIPPSKRTAKSITELKGQLVPDTVKEVDPPQLDGTGPKVKSRLEIGQMSNAITRVF